ncbi:MAG: enoyl-CoA hydratase-related protein, partial [Actinomycetota bacterium]|nr:enoyl-CoA hydratase-related protein [Actinomycetota bacterium]
HTWRLLARTNFQTLRAMVLFGEVLRGPDAYRTGLAWTCVPDENLMEEALTIAQRAATYSKDLTKMTKIAFGELPSIDSSEDAVQHEVVPQVKSMESEEFTRLVQSLQQKISSKSSSKD